MYDKEICSMYQSFLGLVNHGILRETAVILQTWVYFEMPRIS